MPKRKQPDDEAGPDILQKDGPLSGAPLENEYEHLDHDDDDEDDVDEDGVARTTKLRKDEVDEIMHAQEPSTIAQDGDIKFTPFNLTEELEDGHFDKSGNFIFSKKDADDDEVEGGNDTWAESVDWAEVERKHKERSEQEHMSDVKEDMQLLEEKIVRDEYACYREMLRLMRSDETVQRTIRRLGKDIPRRRPSNKNASKSKSTAQTGSSSGPVSSAAIPEDAKRKLDLMIELADQRFREGDMDIYEKSYEDIEEAINSL